MVSSSVRHSSPYKPWRSAMFRTAMAEEEQGARLYRGHAAGRAARDLDSILRFRCAAIHAATREYGAKQLMLGEAATTTAIAAFGSPAWATQVRFAKTVSIDHDFGHPVTARQARDWP